MIPRIRTWSRRKFALYLAATFLGVGVLVALIALVGLLYWMDAKAPAPRPDALWPTAATGIVTISGGLDDFPPPLLDGLLAGLPTQAQMLVKQAAKSDSCHAQVVAFATPSDGAPKRVVVLSLSRYPGRFHLVRRDLERRTAKGGLPFSLRYHKEKTLFVDPSPNVDLPVLALVGCSIIRASDVAAAESIVDILLTPGTSVPHSWQQVGCFVDTQCRTATDLPLSVLLPPEAARRWGDFAVEFDKRFRYKMVLRASGPPRSPASATPPGKVELSGLIAPTESGRTAEMAAWLRSNVSALGLSDVRFSVDDKGMSFEALIKY